MFTIVYLRFHFEMHFDILVAICICKFTVGCLTLCVCFRRQGFRDSPVCFGSCSGDATGWDGTAEE